MSKWRVTIVHNGMRINVEVSHRTGGEALAEACEDFDITFPTYASVVKVPE